MVVRYGKLCWEGGYPTGSTDPYRVFSVTKTMGGLLTGMVASRSELDDTDPVTEWIDARGHGRRSTPRRRSPTCWRWRRPTRTCPTAARRSWTYDLDGSREINKLVGVMDKAIAQEPERFPGATTAAEFAAKELFAPLGMEDSSWPGEQIGGNMISSVRDMAKMGELILQRGRYDGRQILDEEYVYRMTHPSFEDSNTGFGYLAYANALENEVYSTGTADDECAPYTRWPEYPHRPFMEAPDPNGGFPGEQQHDIGVVWAAGAGGQKMAVHRGLDLVIAVRDDNVSVGESEPVGTFEGHKNIWNAIRPALVAMDPVYAGRRGGLLRGLQGEHLRAGPARAVVPAGPARAARRHAAAPAGWRRPLRPGAPAARAAPRRRRGLPATGAEVPALVAGLLALLGAGRPAAAGASRPAEPRRARRAVRSTACSSSASTPPARRSPWRSWSCCRTATARALGAAGRLAGRRRQAPRRAARDRHRRRPARAAGAARRPRGGRRRARARARSPACGSAS